MTAVGRFGGVALDADDPAALCAFYQRLLDLELVAEADGFSALRLSAGCFLTFWRVADHRPPDWPDGSVPKQMHLDVAVTDLDAAEHQAIVLGASRASEQPAPERWRVLIDPAGHPFCLSAAVPDV